jgi:cell division protein FtsL
MNKWQFVLLSALMASCLGLVHTAYETRRLANRIDLAQKEQRRLEVEHRRLDAERQAQATHSRVERVARVQLRTHPATPTTTFEVQAPAMVAASPAATKQPTPALGAAVAVADSSKR